MTSRIQKILPLLLLFTATAAAAENRICADRFDGGIIRYTARDKESAKMVMETYPKCLEEVNRLLARNYKHTVSIYLYRPDCGFEGLGMEDFGRFTRAYAVCGGLFRDSIVILMHRYDGGRSSLRSVLMHETVHLVVGELKLTDRQCLPEWFEEGLAEWAAHRKEGWSHDDRRELRERMKPWRKIAGKFPEYDGEEIHLAYLQSRYIVMFLVEKYGLKAIHTILGLVERGMKFEKAFQAATGVAVAEAERDWREYVSKKTAEEVLLLIVGPLAAFGTGALIIVVAVIGTVRLRRRRRAIIRQFEEEESRRTYYSPDSHAEKL